MKKSAFLAMAGVLAILAGTGLADTVTDIVGLQLWLDASDLTTIWSDTGGTAHPAAGGAVARWDDKSSLGRNVTQSNAGNQPTYQTGTLNGLSTLYFSGDYIGRANDTGITGNADRTLITVWTSAVDNGENYQHTFHMGNNANNEAYGHSVFRGGSGDQIGNHYWSAGFDTTVNGSSNPTMALSTWDGDGGTGSNGLDSWWVNGASAGASDRAALATAANSLLVGSRLAPYAEGIRGNVAEVILYNRVLTAAEQNEVGWYLTQKWGLTTSYTQPAQPGTTLTWNNTVNNWATAHWTGGAPGQIPQIVGTVGDIAIVNGGAVTVAADAGAYSLTLNGGAVSVGAGRTLTLLKDLQAAAGASFSLGAGSKLALQGGSAVGISLAGSATIENTGVLLASHVSLVPGATLTKAGFGKVSFDQSAGANSMNASNTVRVDNGELFMKAASNPLGGANLELNGGTFTVQGTVGLGNVLQVGRFQDGNFAQDFSVSGGAYVDDGSGIFSGQQVLATNPGILKVQSGSLSYGDSSAFNNFFFGANGDTNEYQAVWTGYYTAQVTGSHQFRIQNAGGGDIDDDGSLWMDVNQNNAFNSGEGGTTGGQYTLTANLTAGQRYAVAFGFNENGGGESYRVQFLEPAGGTYTSFTTVDPGAQAGFWVSNSTAAIGMTDTDVRVLANSTLNAITDDVASFGALTFAGNSVLTGKGALRGIAFTGTTFTAGGGTFNTECDVNPGVINDGGNGVTIRKTGAGNLIVNQAASLTSPATSFNVQQGRLVLVGPNPIGSTLVQTSGGTLALTAGAAASEPFNVPVHVTADSFLTVGKHAGGQAGPKAVVLGGAANGISLNSGWLKVTTTDSYTLNIAGPISGSGGIQFQDGANVTISSTGNTPGRVGLQTTANVTGMLTNIQATGGYYLDPTAANQTFTFNGALGSNGADFGAELHIGNDRLTEGRMILGGTNTYSGKTRIARGALQATEGVNLPTASRLEFDGTSRDQAAVLMTQGTFARNIGTNAGEVFWNNMGGFAALGGPLTVTLNGGAEISWTAATGFNNRDSIQFGSRYGDSMVELTNGIDFGGGGDRRFQLQNNYSGSKNDIVRLSGNIRGGSASNQLRFNESSGNDFNFVLVEMLGTNTYLNQTRIDDVTLYAIEGVGLPTNSLLRFEGNDDSRPAVFMSNGTFTRNIGSAAGEVRWDERGGFAARGGTFTITLEGGALLDWGNVDTGFGGRVLQLGSDYADNRVEITNDINLAGNSTTDRHVRTVDNRSTDQDVGVLSGVISGPSRLVRNDHDDYAGTVWLAPSGGRVNTYTAETRIDDGILRAVDGVGLPTASNLQFDADGNDRPSILESSGTFTRAMGTGAGQVRWTSGNGGGFAAFGGPLAVNLYGDGRTITFYDGAGVGLNGANLHLGSPTADNVVDFQNGLALCASSTSNDHRTFRVYDNPYTDQDVAKISGIIQNGPGTRTAGINVDSGRDVYGYGGTLWLAGQNTFPDRIDINDGILRAELGVGIPSSSRIYLGGHNSARPAIFESSGTFARNIGGGSGEVNWGNQGGGFAAWGGPLTVRLENGIVVQWQDGGLGFSNVPTLMLGSPTANDTVTFANDIQLRGDRTIRVFNNFYNTGDYAIISGSISDGTTPARSLTIRGDAMLPGYNATDLTRGTLELSGASTYTGNTYLDDGIRLVLSGSINPAGGTLFVRNGTTLVGGGAAGRATIESGGTVSPGTSVGTLALDYLTMKTGSIYEWELTPTGQDRINTFELTLEPGSILRVLMNETMDMAPGDRFPVFGVGGQIFGTTDGVIIDLSAIDTGQYYLWNDDEMRLAWDMQEQMVYLTGIQAQVNEPPAGDIPEPVTLLALAAGLGSLGGYLRRRRRA